MSEPSTRPYIGGQAVLEGVMMRAPTSFAVVVRRKDGSLVVRERAMKDTRKGMARLPFFRGLWSLVESLRLGSEALRFSADQMQRDLELEERAAAKAPHGLSVLSALGYSLFALATQEPRDDGAAPASPSGGGRSMAPMMIIMVAFLIALPQAAAAGVSRLLKVDLDVQSPQFQALTGFFKLSLVLGYLLLIRRVPDIRRVFQYHGAEHKTISTYEANEPLDVAHARTKTTLHPRCGTTFLVMVVLVSVVLFTVLGAFLPRIHTGSRILDNVVFFLLKLPTLPILAGATFELQRVLARYCTTGPLRALLVPGFLVQRITTVEPYDDQLEVALASLRATLYREQGEGSAAATEVTFPSYAAMPASGGLGPRGEPASAEA